MAGYQPCSLQLQIEVSLLHFFPAPETVCFLRHNEKGFGQERGCYLGSDGVGFVLCREGCKRRISVGMNIM